MQRDLPLRLFVRPLAVQLRRHRRIVQNLLRNHISHLSGVNRQFLGFEILLWLSERLLLVDVFGTTVDFRFINFLVTLIRV